jgi:MATE family multidrug resistance protein
MFFVDRVILAAYSEQAMYAVIVSGNFVSVFAWMLMGVANTSEVFVGQFNGSRQYDKLAIPVWQMIYMSIMSIGFFLPIAYFSEYINILPDYALEDGLDYQKILFYFGFLPVLVASLSAFFIGQGKAGIVTATVIAGNIINALMDYVFIFTLHYGTKGAAMGTVVSNGLQVLVLACVFLNKKNRLSFKTLENFSFNKSMFASCFKVGIPLSISNFFTILSWALVISIIGQASKELGIIWGFASAVYMLISFFAEGLNKAIAAITSNMIGKRDLESIRLVYKRFLFFLVVFCLLLAIPLVFVPDIVLKIFNIGNDLSEIRDQSVAALRLSLAALLLESAEYITWGVLLAGGDTKYPTLVSQICLWGLVVMPTALLFYTGKLTSVITIYFFMILSFTISLILFYMRYKSLKWYKNLV